MVSTDKVTGWEAGRRVSGTQATVPVLLCLTWSYTSPVFTVSGPCTYRMGWMSPCCLVYSGSYSVVWDPASEHSDLVRSLYPTHYRLHTLLQVYWLDLLVYPC